MADASQKLKRHPLGTPFAHYPSRHSGAHSYRRASGYRHYLDCVGALRNAGSKFGPGLFHSRYPRPPGLFRTYGRYRAYWRAGIHAGHNGAKAIPALDTHTSKLNLLPVTSAVLLANRLAKLSGGIMVERLGR